MLKDITAMQKAIYAALCHCSSSEKDNYHVHYTDGKDRWCGFKRDKANGKKILWGEKKPKRDKLKACKRRRNIRIWCILT
jgi:hypothetical protein